MFSGLDFVQHGFQAMQKYTLRRSAYMRFGTDYREDLTLSDGACLRFRAVTPSDKQKLAEGFARLSA
jgi:hypothetical protein